MQKKLYTEKLKKKRQNRGTIARKKIFIIHHIKNAKKLHPKNTKKCIKCTQKLQKSQKNAKKDTSGITDILPGLSPYWSSPITSFHDIGYPRYYRDILVPVTHTLHTLSITTPPSGICRSQVSGGGGGARCICRGLPSCCRRPPPSGPGPSLHLTSFLPPYPLFTSPLPH